MNLLNGQEKVEGQEKVQDLKMSTSSLKIRIPTLKQMTIAIGKVIQTRQEKVSILPNYGCCLTIL